MTKIENISVTYLTFKVLYVNINFNSILVMFYYIYYFIIYKNSSLQ